VHGRADAVPAVLLDDAVRGAVAAPGGLRSGLHGVRDVGEACVGPDGRDPGVQGLPARRRQRQVGRRDGADGERDGGVAVPALDDRPAVDRQEVAVGEDLRGCGDAG
jgi:hypothetical protein